MFAILLYKNETKLLGAKWLSVYHLEKSLQGKRFFCRVAGLISVHEAFSIAVIVFKTACAQHGK